MGVRWELQLYKERASLPSYAISVLCVAIAMGSWWIAHALHLRDVAFPLLCLAIAYVSWSRGPGPGALAVLLSTVFYDYFIAEPVFSFEVSTPELLRFVLFILSAVIVAYFAALQRQNAQTLRDARDRLQAELDWRAEQDRLLDQTHDAIIFRSFDGKISYWNHGAQEMFGWTAQQAIGRSSHDLLHTVFPAPLEQINEQLERTGLWEGELTHTRADGTHLISASRWSLRRDESGRPRSVMETNNDITDRKRREHEIGSLNAALADRAGALQAANKELDSFAYSVSHDLRAPLRHVVGFAELLQKHAASSLDEKSRGYVRTIQDSARRMGNLIDDLLSFSRMGRAETKKTMVSLEQLVHEAIAEVGAETGGREIAWKIGTLPSCYGDRSMLKLVLQNLIGNAVKFTRPREHAEIEIGCMAEKPNETVVFVRDNGVGFDMRHADKLFGVFQRLHRLEEFDGTGIGLATVQRIIHRHGGEIRAEAVPDGGATFYFSLPAAGAA
jgi:PAS domain S-box-containing protein